MQVGVVIAAYNGEAQVGAALGRIPGFVDAEASMLDVRRACAGTLARMQSA
jgi:hypothetical protein